MNEGQQPESGSASDPPTLTIVDIARDETSSRSSEDIPYRKLYLSHFFRTWGDRLFEFGAALFIIDIFRTTLLESSLYGLLTTAFGLLFGDVVGKWVDRVPRYDIIKYLIPIQKLTVILSHVGFWALLTYFSPGSESKSNDIIAFIIFSAVILLGGMYKVTTIGMNVALERDWIVLLAAGNSPLLTCTYISSVSILYRSHV
jgi:iron-regulated transporter 1